MNESHNSHPNEEIKLLDLNQQVITPNELNFRILVIGYSKVGKTSLINTICGCKYSDRYSKTLCCDVRNKKFQILGKIVKVKFYEIGGEIDLFDNILVLKEYLQLVHACVFVCDIAKPDSINFIENLINELTLSNIDVCNFLVMNSFYINKVQSESNSYVDFKIKKSYNVNIKSIDTVNKFFDSLLESLMQYSENGDTRNSYVEKNNIIDTNLYFKFKLPKQKIRCYC